MYMLPMILQLNLIQTLHTLHENKFHKYVTVSSGRIIRMMQLCYKATDIKKYGLYVVSTEYILQQKYQLFTSLVKCSGQNEHSNYIVLSNTTSPNQQHKFPPKHNFFLKRMECRNYSMRFTTLASAHQTTTS
jgi:hypothetical protein